MNIFRGYCETKNFKPIQMIRHITGYLEELKRNAIRTAGMVCAMILVNSGDVLSQEGPKSPEKVFKAGAAVSNITPKVGTSINGNMHDMAARNFHFYIFAGSIVLDVWKNRLDFV